MRPPTSLVADRQISTSHNFQVQSDDPDFGGPRWSGDWILQLQDRVDGGAAVRSGGTKKTRRAGAQLLAHQIGELQRDVWIRARAKHAVSERHLEGGAGGLEQDEPGAVDPKRVLSVERNDAEQEGQAQGSDS